MITFLLLFRLMLLKAVIYDCVFYLCIYSKRRILCSWMYIKDVLYADLTLDRLNSDGGAPKGAYSSGITLFAKKTKSLLQYEPLFMHLIKRHTLLMKTMYITEKIRMGAPIGASSAESSLFAI